MKATFPLNRLLLSGLWLSAVPWLLFPTVAPLLTAVSLVLLLLLLFIPKRGFQRFTLPATLINSYLLLFLLLTGVACLASPLPDISLPKLTAIILGAATFFLLLPRLDSPQKVEWLIIALAVSAGLVALAGFFTLEWPDRQVIDLRPITDRLPHLSGSFTVNYNEMAGTLLMMLPFGLAAVRLADGRFQKLLFLIILIILITLLIFTQSRGAILGLAISGLTWWIWGRLPLRKLLPGIIILCLGLLIFSLVAGISFNDLIDWLTTLDAGSKQGDGPATSWLARVEIWRVAGQLVADYPVIGSGLYTFDPVSRANYVYETIPPSFNLTHAHNLFLQTLSSLGIGGLLALLGIWLVVLILLWRASQADNGQPGRFSAVFAASIAGYLFFNIFDTITFGQKPGLFVWVVLAGGLGVSQLAKAGSTENEPSTNKTRQLTVSRALSFAPLGALILLLFSPAWPKNLANLKLDRAYLQSQSRLQVTTADFVGDIRRAGMVYHLQGEDVLALAAWQQDPQSASFLHSQGTIAFMSGRLAEAVAWYDLALALAPDSAETYLWRGIANEERGTLGLAEADFWKAAEYSAESEVGAGTKAYIHYRLGNLLARKEEWHSAAAAFTQATIYEPEESWYYRVLGDALAALGDERGAADAYQKAER